MRASHVLLASLLFPLAACERGAPGAPAVAPPPEASAAPRAASSVLAPAAPALLCEPRASRCASDDEAERCRDDGAAWEQGACASTEACLAGSCTALGGLERSRLLAVGGEGWLDAWSASAPLPAPRAAALLGAPGDLFAPETDLAYRALCAPDGYVTVQPAADRSDTGLSWRALTGYLVSGREQPVRLAWGASGGFHVVVNGAEVITANRPGARPLPDESEAPALLRRGLNTIAILMEQTTSSATGFWLRVRDERGAPPDGLLLATGRKEAACGLGDLARLGETRAPVAGGFAVELSPRLLGAGPRGEGELDYAVQIKKGSAAPREVARGKVSAESLWSGRARLALSVLPGSSGRHELTFTLGGQGGFSRALPVVYRGALHERVVELGRARADFARESMPRASRDSFDSHVRTLERALDEGHPDESWIKALTEGAESIAHDAAKGLDPYHARTGVVFRAYRSELDGELQPYVIYVPRSYRPDGKALPLVFAMHGLNQPPELALRSVIGEAPDETMDRGWAARHLPGFPDHRAFLVAPTAFRNAGPRPLGEEDVLAVLAEMRASYRVDDARVSMTGYSLGGTVSFVVPLHHADLFSAAAPLCGYPNLVTYDSVRSVPHTPWEDVLLAKRYIGGYADNGMYLPLYVVHGGQDGPARSAGIVKRYRDLGYPVDFDVQDDLAHDVWTYAYEDGRMIPRLTARRRPAAPAHVRLVTGEYRYDRAYWVRLIAMRDSRLVLEPGGAPALASIDASFQKGPLRLTVTTRNVAAFALDLRPLGATDGVTAVVDGQTLEIPKGSQEAYFSAAGGAWERASSEPSREGKKRPGVSGPLDDVLRHRQLIVYGTLDPSQTEANLLAAQHFSSDDQWAGAHFPIKADAEVTEADMQGRSLVLIGGPSSNRVTAGLAESLPVRFEPNALILRGQRYEGAEVGVSLVYPHPRDAREYVVLHAGTTARGTLGSRYLPELSPDYLVYDTRITGERGGVLLGSRPVLAGGFFDDDWQ